MERRSKTRRKMQTSSTWVAPKIPQDLLIEILARLPAKSVLRFKCISKFWLSLFCSTYFCNRFFMLPSPPQPRGPRLYMSLVDLGNYSESLLLSSAPTTSSPSSFVLKKDLTIREMGGRYMRAVRGFIGFTVSEKEGRIYNPSTRQLVILPPIKSKKTADEIVYNRCYYICYDPVNDKYKVLCTIAVVSEDWRKIRTEFWLLLLEAGGSWKRVAKDFHPHLPNPLELTMNGVLYYLAWTDSHTCVLVSFDIRSEEFKMLQVPRKPEDVLSMSDKWVTQIDYGGKVAVFDYTYIKKSGTVDLWIVEDWRKKEWSMKTLVLEPSQMHLIITNNLKPKSTTMLKGKIFLVPLMLTPSFYVLSYDLESNDLQKVKIEGIPDGWYGNYGAIYFDMEFMDPSENIKYLET